jgi:hypothetical protein
MWWTLGSLTVVVIAVYMAAVSAEEPLRRYMEREINNRLTGYTVRVPGLDVHPWRLAIELRDATIVQNANPEPPVAQIAGLEASIDWRALVHRQVVADITFDRPRLYVNLKHVRAEAASKVPMKDEGWQQALEAVAFDLKINRLRVRDGDVTYVDQGPFKPLHVSHIGLAAENIRNVKSKERVYPSDVHLEGIVFDVGHVWLDGHADFLAEPHVGIKAAVKVDGVELDYFKPITSRYNVSVQKGVLSLTGDLEYAPNFKRAAVERMVVEGVHVEYVHQPRTAEAERARAAETVRTAKEVANHPSIELRVDRLDVMKSTLGFVDQASNPPYRIALTSADISLEQLSNQKAQGTAVARVSGKLNGSGATRAVVKIRPETRNADIDVKAEVVDVDMRSLNDLVRAYGGFGVVEGQLSMYSELRMDNGTINGYVKPLFRGVKPGDNPPGEPKTFGKRLYEGLVGIAAKILKNRPRAEVATVVPITGQVDRPQVDIWAAVGGLLRNAFLSAILPGFEPEKSPRAGERPAKTEPAKSDPAKTEPAKTEPAKIPESSRSEPPRSDQAG